MGSERYPLPPGFERVAEIGRGGMARVFEVICTRTNERYALKVSSPDLGEDGTQLALREAWIASRVIHPNIARVYAYGRIGDRVWMQMDLVRGTALVDLLKRVELPMRRRLEILRDVARVLGDLHDMGVVHQDVKAHNLMVREDGSVSLIDFGIAKLEHEPNVDAVVIGTPSRMPPERLLGQPSDRRADVFQLGALAYDLLATRGPWDKLDDPLETALKICSEAPVDLRSVIRSDADGVSDIVAAIAPLVQLMIANDPTLRPRDARELSSEIDAALEHDATDGARVWLTPAEVSAPNPTRELVYTAA